MFFTLKTSLRELKANTFLHMSDVLGFSQFENTASESNKIVCEQHKAAVQISRTSSRIQVVKWRANGLLRTVSALVITELTSSVPEVFISHSGNIRQHYP